MAAQLGRESCSWRMEGVAKVLHGNWLVGDSPIGLWKVVLLQRDVLLLVLWYDLPDPKPYPKVIVDHFASKAPPCPGLQYAVQTPTVGTSTQQQAHRRRKNKKQKQWWIPRVNRRSMYEV